MKNSRKIVLVNQSTGYTTIDIANNLNYYFESVALICGSIREQETLLSKNIIVSKIIPKIRNSSIGRLLSWIIATIQIIVLLLTKYRKYEIFYFTLPPFSYFCSILLKRRYSIMVYDVYPDILKIININENNIIFKTWVKLNISVFKKANKVFTISEGMAKILENYVDAKKIKVIKLWGGFKTIQKIKKDYNPFVEKFNLKEKFIVQYSGNIGLTHQIEVLIELATNFINDLTIQFVIIGRGIKYDYIKSQIEKNKLANILLMPFLPDEEIKYSLSAADINVVVIDEKTAQMSIPSKIYNLMAVGSAIMAVSPTNSELSKLISLYEMGKSFNTTELDKMKEFIIKLKTNRDILEKYKYNALFNSKHHTFRNANIIYNEYINVK